MTIQILTQGSNAERGRVHNRGLVLAHLRQEGEAGRAQIARASGLSTQAVSNIIAELLDEGWVHEVGRISAGRGLPTVTYAIRARAAAAFGLEIRPGAILAALIDLEGGVLYSERVALAEARPDRVLPLATELLARASKSARIARERLIGAGVVMPGPFGATGLSGRATDLPGWEAIDAVAAFSEALGMPVTVENDANAAAVAERLSGVAQGLSTYAYLYFGTGLGLGLVIDGAIYRGVGGNAGEIGHIPVSTAHGMLPLEDVVSRLALARALTDAGLDAEQVEDLEAALTARAPAMSTWLEAARAALGPAIGIVENLFDPETIVLGGAMPGVILTDLCRSIRLPEASIANRADRTVPRLQAGTAGRMTATIGAAALVVNTVLSPRLAMSV